MKLATHPIKFSLPHILCAFPFLILLTMAAFHRIEGPLVASVLPISLVLCALPYVFSFLSRYSSLKHGATELRMIEQQVEKLANRLESIHEQGTTFNKHNKAFNDARDKVHQILLNEPEAQIEFRLLVVSMRFSLEYLKKDFATLARDFPQARLDWKICMTSPEYLERFRIDDSGECNWVQLGRSAIENIKEIKERIAAKKVPGALSIDYRLYDAIPHWHGLLIRVNSPAEDHLYLGRTDWKIRIDSNPVLTVGSNPYLYFNPSTEAGRRHIDSFRHWFSIYERWQHFSKKEGPTSKVQGARPAA